MMRWQSDLRRSPCVAAVAMVSNSAQSRSLRSGLSVCAADAVSSPLPGAPTPGAEFFDILVRRDSIHLPPRARSCDHQADSERSGNLPRVTVGCLPSAALLFLWFAVHNALATGCYVHAPVHTWISTDNQGSTVLVTVVVEANEVLAFVV